VVLLGLAVLGWLAHRVKLSPVPFYLLSGMVIGPHGPLPMVAAQNGAQFLAVGAELGGVLLLLTLGLEYAPDELLAGLRRNIWTGLLDVLLNATPGAAIALILGWGPVAAIALAGITYVSSSGIVAKLLADLGHLGNREPPAIIAILVLEDLTMAAYLPVLSAVLSGIGVLTASANVVGALLAVVTVFTVAVRYPGAMARVVFSPNDEVLLLRVLGLAVLVAGIAAQLKVSASIGAFLVGVSLSGPVAETASQLMRPLRDLFAAMFFVFFGMQIDPAQIRGVWTMALILAAVSGTTKVAIGWWSARREGIGVRGRFRAGVALVPRGEFSIVIAGLATTAARSGDAAVDPRFGPLVGTYVTLLAIAAPLATRLVDSIRRPSTVPVRSAAPASAGSS
jgi:CPA2 family monovalent cation:H+ antiporter-2